MVGAITNRFPHAEAARRIAEPATAAPEIITSRAVIALEPISRDLRPMPRRPRADFLAQLIANAEHLPQTRDKRRAEPAVAMQAYAAVRDAAPAGRKARLERVA